MVFVTWLVDVCVKLNLVTSILLVISNTELGYSKQNDCRTLSLIHSISFSLCIHTYERYMTWISWVLILAVHTVCSCKFLVDTWFDSFHIFGGLGTWQSFLETKTISDEGMQFMNISSHSCVFACLKCQPAQALGFHILSLNSICH